MRRGRTERSAAVDAVGCGGTGGVQAWLLRSRADASIRPGVNGTHGSIAPVYLYPYEGFAARRAARHVCPCRAVAPKVSASQGWALAPALHSIAHIDLRRLLVSNGRMSRCLCGSTWRRPPLPRSRPHRYHYAIPCGRYAKPGVLVVRVRMEPA